MVLLLRIPFFRLPLTCCQDEEISSVVSLLTCFSSRCASRGLDIPASSTVTQKLLEWRPQHPGLIADFDEGHYFEGKAV